MAGYENPFLTLGLHPKVVKETPDTKLADLIDVQYRAMSRLHHPDKGGDAEKFRLIREAYDDLSDPVACIQFAREYRASKREQSIVMNERLVASLEANTNVLGKLSDFVKAIASDRALPNLEPGWIFAGRAMGASLTVFEVGENHLLTTARHFQHMGAVQWEVDDAAAQVPMGYYLARDGKLVTGITENGLFERVAFTPTFTKETITEGNWYHLGSLSQFGNQHVTEFTPLGRPAPLSWRPLFMVGRGKSSEAEFVLSGQLAAPKKNDRRRRINKIVDGEELNLKAVYSLLEPYPILDSDLFVRDQEGRVFSLKNIPQLMSPTKGFNVIIPPVR